MAAPRRPLGEVGSSGTGGRAARSAPRPAGRPRSRAPTPSERGWRSRSRKSSRNGWWWPYSSPSVAITTSGGSSSGMRLGRQPGLEPLVAERGRRRPVARGLEGDRRRQLGVVQRDDDAPAGAEVDAVGPARLDVRIERLPRREDRVLGRRPRRASGASAGRPRSRAATSRRPAGRSAARSRAGPSGSRSRRSAAEASGRIVWWNGWARPLTPRSPATKPR